jgi:hypothetical protein
LQLGRDLHLAKPCEIAGVQFANLAKEGLVARAATHKAAKIIDFMKSSCYG